MSANLQLNQLPKRALCGSNGIRSADQKKVPIPQTHNQTQQVIKHGDRLRHDPGDDPNTNTNGDPGPDRQETSVMHLVGATEDAHVDVFAGNVAKYDT